MHGSSLLRRGLNFRTVFLGAFVGANAALPLYLWQLQASVAIACWIVVGYTVWLWAATAEVASEYRHLCGELRLLPFNTWWRRLGRMLCDWGFWWTTMFGCATITGSAWYVGLKNEVTLVLIGGGWCLVSCALNWGLTLLHPTTRCRRCYYQLAAHLDQDDTHQRVICPECGAAWTKAELGLAMPPRAAAANNPTSPAGRRRRARETRMAARSAAMLVNADISKQPSGATTARVAPSAARVSR